MSAQLKNLFGGSNQWPKFKPVNDTLRGGSSTSYLKSNENNEATFSGHLDIKTLGGAGFASQCHSFSPLPLSLPSKTYSGLTLLLPLPTYPLLPNQPSSFVLTLKNVIPAARNYGGGEKVEEADGTRRESVINYEFSFDLKDLKGSESLGEKDEGMARVDMRWSEFKAVYRGRPQKDASPLDTEKLTELSIMCRSDFGKQEGDFELRIHSLSATLLPTLTSRSLLDRLREWFSRMRAWLMSGGNGRIKL